MVGQAVAMSIEDTDSLALRIAIGLDAPLIVEREVLGANRQPGPVAEALAFLQEIPVVG